MKRLLFILLSIVPIIVSAQDYYWYDGTKIPLERGNQEYIIYDDSLLLESDKENYLYTCLKLKDEYYFKEQELLTLLKIKGIL